VTEDGTANGVGFPDQETVQLGPPSGGVPPKKLIATEFVLLLTPPPELTA
jgi:hypothetical protein